MIRSGLRMSHSTAKPWSTSPMTLAAGTRTSSRKTMFEATVLVPSLGMGR